MGLPSSKAGVRMCQRWPHLSPELPASQGSVPLCNEALAPNSAGGSAFNCAPSARSPCATGAAEPRRALGPRHRGRAQTVFFLAAPREPNAFLKEPKLSSKSRYAWSGKDFRSCGAQRTNAKMFKLEPRLHGATRNPRYEGCISQKRALTLGQA